MSASTNDDLRAIQSLIDTRAQSLRSKDATGSMATQTQDFAQYPLFAELQYAGATATDIGYVQRAFDGFEGPISYEVVDQSVRVSGDLAVSHSLSHISGKIRSGGALDMWFRKTLTFIRSEGVWLIAQEHESVPIAADGAAATSLRP